VKIFLEWKSWQIFLLIVIFPFATQSLIMKAFINSAETDPSILFTVMPLFMLIFIGIYLLWFWSLGTELNKIVPENIRLKATRFKFGIKFCAIYMVFFQIFFVATANGNSFGALMPIIFILHIVAMYFMFYSIYFISKNLVTFENHENDKSASSKGTFFLMWFFPLGIWFIQPRINKMYAAKNT
jgi:uncharacterized membrane protein YfbV (UPF0208 family)